MDYNPLTRTCTEIQKQIDGLQQSEKQVADELQWYSSVDPHTLTEDLRRNEAKAEKLQLDVQALEQEIDENKARLRGIKIKTLLNPFNWFAKDQVDLRRRRAQLRETGEQKAAQKQSKVKDLEDTRARMAKVTSDLQRQSSFDLSLRQSDLLKIKESIVSKKKELELAAERKRRVDEVLVPLIQEMQNLESRKCRARSDLETAWDFDDRLSSAENSYERRLIHDDCEHEFGERSLGRIVSELK